jgi:hypothetical protein
MSSIFFFSRRKQKKNNDVEEEDTRKATLLCRFVFDGAGKKIGESVSVDEDVLIIKSRNTYLGVPLKHIEVGDKSLIVKGLVDLSKAKEMGEKWREESFCKIDYPEEAQGGRNDF